jgi:hypothetical protein
VLASIESYHTGVVLVLLGRDAKNSRRACSRGIGAGLLAFYDVDAGNILRIQLAQYGGVLALRVDADDGIKRLASSGAGHWQLGFLRAGVAQGKCQQ